MIKCEKIVFKHSFRSLTLGRTFALPFASPLHPIFLFLVSTAPFPGLFGASVDPTRPVAAPTQFPASFFHVPSPFCGHLRVSLYPIFLSRSHPLTCAVASVCPLPSPSCVSLYPSLPCRAHLEALSFSFLFLGLGCF